MGPSRAHIQLVYTKNNLNAQVKSVLKAPSVGVSHFIVNDINASVKQTMNIRFDVLELGQIDMKYKIESDEAGVQFEPPKLNKSQKDRTRRLKAPQGESVMARLDILQGVKT